MKRVETRKESAVDDFRAAVLAFSNDPSSRNLVRYLMASRALELSRGNSASKRRLSGPKPYTAQAA
jgi:hypothetical protein